MTAENNSWDEQRLAEVFSSVDRDVPPVDEELLARLREQSTEAFEAQSDQASEAQSTPQPQPEETAPSARRPSMFALATRALVSASAVALVIGATLWSLLGPDDSAALGDVLAKVARAETLELEIIRGDQSVLAWTKGPDRLRINAPDGTYQIARGGRTWLVDERANRAASGPSSCFRKDPAGVDVLALLELPGLEEKVALGSRPAQRRTRDGREWDVYRADLRATGGPIELLAWVDLKTQTLNSLEATADLDGKRKIIARLKVLAVGEPVDDSLFVVGDTLTEDGRVGKVLDVQGIVTIKPATARRWTPVATQMLLKPGDWVRTDVRGANAVALWLVQQTAVTLGPGSLLEVIKPNQIRLVHGELKITADAKAPVELLGPNNQKIQVTGTRLFLLKEEKLVHLNSDPEKHPLWLKGFEGATANESIGSLIVKVKGHNVPLTVGYHTVTVDVRDQIARTVIEESFVNHTSTRLEGTFHFPLPQDASISGFGMWIGNELVEADVVEKQRAREIYEEILRQKRDPGLLEWAGGNIFKARVFPIEPHREKRVKITYTQVLPLKDGRYRYSYALQSEMLKQNPLRELTIDVKINSATPLAAVSSPTHTAARIGRTKHSAQVEFTAQEYTPTSDFEVVVQPDGRQSDVVLIPHVRGKDGYFMMQLTPPAELGGEGWQREIVPDGEPLELLILADTSASLDDGNRKTQAEFVAALLSSLAPEDRFNLAGCDVDCHWVFERPTRATDKSVERARGFLADRLSLGWTDLDRAFASALKQCGPKTRIVYIGDGIVTGGKTVGSGQWAVGSEVWGEGGPVSFGKRLKRMFDGKTTTCHAVTVGSSFEPIVVKTIASLGGGSVRNISGAHGPQAVAIELLAEMARPAIRNLKVAFKGFIPGGVYPEELPNLAPGTQQIVLGRYLPTGRDQAGEVIVTGTRDGKPVRFHADVTLAGKQGDESFIPRLWARMHLDYLLEQGATSVIKDEIIALSEEYHIMTPYTSLLVLESDADRERFKVKRRFQMRDGEGYFAKGRDNANYELKQQQMRRAGDWRIGIRRAALAELTGLGRDANMVQPPQLRKKLALISHQADVSGSTVWLSDGFARRGGSMHAWNWSGSTLTAAESISGFAKEGGYDMDGLIDAVKRRVNPAGDDGYRKGLMGMGEPGIFSGDMDLLFMPDSGDEKSMVRFLMAPVSSRPVSRYRLMPDYILGGENARRYKSSFGTISDGKSRGTRSPWKADPLGINGYLGDRWDTRYSSRGEPDPAQYTHWVNSLFPNLPAVPQKIEPPKPERPWPADAKALAKTLLRTEFPAKIKGGLQIDCVVESFDVRFKELSSRSQALALVSPTAWLTVAENDGSQGIISWCDRRERGALSTAYKLGRVRKSEPMDLSKPPIGLPAGMLNSLDRVYQQYTVEVKPQGDDRTMLLLRQPNSPDHEIRMLIDTRRHVMLSQEHYQKDKLTSGLRHDDFVEVAGTWWIGRVERFDAKRRRTSVVVRKYEHLTADRFTARRDKQLAVRDRVQLLHMPQPTVVDAKRAVADGKATFDHRFAMMLHFCRSQQWDRVTEHLAEAEKAAAVKPPMRWVRHVVMDVARRREELKGRVLSEAERLAKPQAADGDDYFLAQRLFSRANNFLQANEMLDLLDRLKPVYERQPPRLFAMKTWGQSRIQHLQQTGQLKESLALHRQLADQFPRDAGLQTEFADALARRGEYKAAYAWLDRTMADRDAKWRPDEWDLLRNTYTHWLRNQGRYTELVDFLAEWVKRNPESLYAYQQYLTALVRTDREDEANKLVERWIRDAIVPPAEEARDGDELVPHEVSRLRAAVSQALGQGHNLQSNRLEERWLDRLAQTAWHFARHKTLSQVADQIMNNGHFHQTDQCRAIRKKAAGVLLAEIDRLPLVDVQRFVGWIRYNDPAVEKPTWQRIADGLAKRWAAAKDPDEKNRFAQPLIRILSGHVGAEEHLAFLRRQLQEGPKRYRTSYAGQLFNALLGQPWTQQHEDEAFGLLEQLSEAKEPAEKLAVEVQALYRLTDTMIQGRHNALMAKVSKQHELTRIKLREKQTENLKAAREGFSARLRRAVGEHSDSLGPWLRIERLYIETILRRDLDRVTQGCWELLGPEPKTPPEKPGPAYALHSVVKNRCLITLANLAARPSAEKASVDRLLRYVDRAIALDLKRNAKNIGWKSFKYKLLIALDRPKDLETALTGWLRPDEPDSLWRRCLAYLLAERGEITPAIDHFKVIVAADELSPGDYRTLADWYMVVDDRDAHEQALIAALKTTAEWQLNQYLSRKLNPWQRSEGHLPGELDKQVIRVFAVLFEKSGSPQNYLGQLRSFYQATHDFRLLACLADGVVGHTAGKVYPFLGGMNSVLSEIRDEATSDSVVEHLAEVRKRAKTDVDRRALDLLETQVERRAAELLNQPGPHIDLALAALKRAFEHEWSDGEPRLMADFLASLGRITPDALADEQLRQLGVLHERAKRGSEDRLHIAHSLAKALWSYSRQDEAIDLLAAALNEFEEASGGVLPTSANGPIGSLVSYLEGRHHFARGERFLQDQLEHPANPQQTRWLTMRLYQLYEAAIGSGGEVSLGSGKTLFQAVVGKILDDLTTDDNNQRYTLVDQLCRVHRTAHGMKIPGVVDSLKAFASDRLPDVLRRQTDNYQSVVVHVAGTLYTLASPRDGLAFLIERIEREPSWLRYNNQDGWSRHASQLARWRIEAGTLGDLKPRLLAIVLAELRRDLRYRQSRNREMYHNGHTRFWSEVRSAYARTAEEVYAERKRSGAAVQYIAEYLYHGLDLRDRAVEILLIAHRDKLLDENGQAKLVDFLQGTDCYGESIAVLLPLVELRPDRMTYRVELMRAYFHSKRPAQLRELLGQIDEHFHQQGRWTESAMNELAYGCLRCTLFKESVVYYEEAIKLRQRTAPNRGIGDGTLSNYYKYQGEAYAGMGNTAKAVEAACGAVVSWGPTHGNRASALRHLERVLENSPDLDDFVATLDREAAQSKQDKPIVRKALGRVYLGKRQYAKAIVQLKLAVELQPNDRETHEALIDCYDRQDDKQGALRQTLASLQLSRRDIGLYKKLAERFEQLERAEDAERSYTSIVEMLPSESESHAMLAEIRQGQDRWEDAAAHWRQVAEIRALEPAGLLKLAGALIRLEQWDQAEETLKKLRSRGWPPRFKDELRELPNLERSLEKGRR